MKRDGLNRAYKEHKCRFHKWDVTVLCSVLINKRLLLLSSLLLLLLLLFLLLLLLLLLPLLLQKLLFHPACHVSYKRP